MPWELPILPLSPLLSCSHTSESRKFQTLDFPFLSFIKDIESVSKGNFRFPDHSIQFYWEHFLLSHKVLNNKTPGSKIPMYIILLLLGDLLPNSETCPILCAAKVGHLLCFSFQKQRIPVGFFQLCSPFFCNHFFLNLGALMNPWRHCNINARQM